MLLMLQILFVQDKMFPKTSRFHCWMSLAKFWFMIGRGKLESQWSLTKSLYFSWVIQVAWNLKQKGLMWGLPIAEGKSLINNGEWSDLKRDKCNTLASLNMKVSIEHYIKRKLNPISPWHYLFPKSTLFRKIPYWPSHCHESIEQTYDNTLLNILIHFRLCILEL